MSLVLASILQQIRRFLNYVNNTKLVSDKSDIGIEYSKYWAKNIKLIHYSSYQLLHGSCPVPLTDETWLLRRAHRWA